MRLNDVLECRAESALDQKWFVVDFALRKNTWEIFEAFLVQGFENLAFHIVDEFF